MEIIGKIKEVFPIIEGISMKGNPYKSVQFLIETQDKYPKKVCITILGADKVDKFLPLLRIGGIALVKFDLLSSEFNSRWRTDVLAWHIEIQDQQEEQYNVPAF